MKPPASIIAAAEPVAVKKSRPKVEYDTSIGFFGAPLDNDAPIVLCDCMSFLRTKGLYEQGIFRLPGSQEVVESLKESYNQAYDTQDKKKEGIESVLNKYIPSPSVADIASLMKAFFYDLPEPLIDTEFAKELIILSLSERDQKTKGEMISRVLKKMPSVNQKCLGLLISFLREVCNYTDVNNMDAANLGTCFMLCLMKTTDMALQMHIARHGGEVVRLLIVEAYFKMPSVSRVKANTRYVPVDDVEDLLELPPPNPDVVDEEESIEASKAKKIFAKRGISGRGLGLFKSTKWKNKKRGTSRGGSVGKRSVSYRPNARSRITFSELPPPASTLRPKTSLAEPGLLKNQAKTSSQSSTFFAGKIFVKGFNKIRTKSKDHPVRESRIGKAVMPSAIKSNETEMPNFEAEMDDLPPRYSDAGIDEEMEMDFNLEKAASKLSDESEELGKFLGDSV